MLRTALIIAVFAALLGSTSAQAQDRVYDDGGSVWAISFIETKAGQFDNYIANLNQIWRQYLDAQKDDGHVLSYKMIPIVSPRDGEPNLMLMVEFKNWAAFDAMDNEYFDNLAGKLQGSVDNATQSNVDREEIRSLRGGFMGQEITFR